MHDAQFDLKDCYFSGDSTSRDIEPKVVGIFAFSPFSMTASMIVMSFSYFDVKSTRSAISLASRYEIENCEKIQRQSNELCIEDPILI